MLGPNIQLFALQHGNEIPTIDVALVTISTDENETEIGLTTASSVQVNPQTESEDANKLVVKGVLLAQKPATVTITGNTIVLSDNVLNPELLKVLQGGTITYKSGSSGPVAKYEPPAAGSSEKGEPFTLNLYSAIYGTDGIISGYEKVTYPNCQGTPWAPGSEDGTWRVAEYTINSAPSKGQAPYIIEYVDELPSVAPAPVGDA